MSPTDLASWYLRVAEMYAIRAECRRILGNVLAANLYAENYLAFRELADDLFNTPTET